MISFTSSDLPDQAMIAMVTRFAAVFLLAMAVGGCTQTAGGPGRPSPKSQYLPGTIISAETEKPVSFEAMIRELETARVIYVGETHTRKADHQAQLKILKALDQQISDLIVGMEMFSRPYQPVLDAWSSGKLSETAFIRDTHWYANWKFDYDLYKALLDYIREQRIALYALNIEFHIPSRVAAGGIDSLLAHDRARLPESIFLDDSDHRQYVQDIFDKHGRAATRYSFENFYQAQCVWEDVMAESVSRRLKDRTMLVFAGNGHITHKFGIPDRAFERTSAPFKTVMPTSGYDAEDLRAADYIWITPDKPESPH